MQALSLAPATALLPKRGAKLDTASNSVTVPGWVVSGLVCFFFGAILGPAFYSASEAGARRLKEIAEKKIRG